MSCRAAGAAVTRHLVRMCASTHQIIRHQAHLILVIDLQFPHNVVSLAVEREPLVQHRHLRIAQVRTLRAAVLGLARRRGQRSRRIFAGEYCRE